MAMVVDFPSTFIANG